MNRDLHGNTHIKNILFYFLMQYFTSTGIYFMYVHLNFEINNLI